MKLYNSIKHISKPILFQYSALFICFLFCFKFFDIKLNIILAFFCAIITILYLEDKRITNNETKDKQHEEKLSLIIPEPVNFDNYKDIVDFTFSIQHFYIYNPQAYEDYIHDLEDFIKLYEYVTINKASKPEYYYNLALNKKNSCTNSIASIIFKIEANKKLTKKLNKACIKLQELLDKRLNEMYDIYQKDIFTNGYDVSRNLIIKGPRPMNQLIDFDKNFTYDFY
tara:strand:- start:2981 stop:3658 length:678 start_codon:yes stop_codon:yes gene_type:complete